MLRVSLLGNLGADPELRYTQKGTQVAQFNVAVNQVRTGPDGERQENTEWFRVRVTGVRADHMMRLNKGTRVLVIGRLDIGQYQSKQGETRTSFDVWADEVQALGPRVAGAAFEPQADSQSDAAPQRAANANGTRTRTGRGSTAVAEADPKASSETGSDLEDLPF